MKRLAIVLAVPLTAWAVVGATGVGAARAGDPSPGNSPTDEPAVAAPPEDKVSLFNPYQRPKNGPPLTNIFQKAKPWWIRAKLKDPQHHPSARMRDVKFSDEEVLDVMAYLKSIAEPAFPMPIQWPAWAEKGFEEMTDEEFQQTRKLIDRGKAIWGNARCTICHTAVGPGKELIGGFVDLRVGGIDLQIAGTKLRRDWLYGWMKDPRRDFPDTLMPRLRFSDEEAVGLVEYILRDDAFRPPREPEPEAPEQWKVLEQPQRAVAGKRLIEMSRCVVCHDIQGIAEVISPPQRQPPPPKGGIEFLVYDLRCLSCHAIEGRGGTYAPDLSGAGSRLETAWVLKFLESPNMIRPLSQQMPKLNLTSEEAKALASYLSESRRDGRIPDQIPGLPSVGGLENAPPNGRVTSKEIERGREQFQAKGCLSCHPVGEGPGGVVGPDLATVGDRLKPGFLWYHLKKPHAVNPYSAEPDFGLSDEEARVLAAYLSTKKKP